jgi:hypothetical protein
MASIGRRYPLPEIKPMEVTMAERDLAKDDRHELWQDEARARRFVMAVGIARCVMGPLVLFGLLLSTAHWEPAAAAHTAHPDYFPAHYVNAANVVDDHIQAF